MSALSSSYSPKPQRSNKYSHSSCKSLSDYFSIGLHCEQTFHTVSCRIMTSRVRWSEAELSFTHYNVTFLGDCVYRRCMDWWMDLLTTCIHHSELHFTVHWYTQTSVLSLLLSPLVVSWQRLLPREIIQFPALSSSCHSRSCRTLVNWLLN
jgi:hypothetical protein